MSRPVAGQRSGTLETVRDSRGKVYYRGKVRLQDGTLARIAIPEKIRRNETLAREYLEARQQHEDQTGKLHSAKLAKQRKSGAAEPRTGPPSGEWTIGEYKEHFFKARRASGRVEDVDSEEGRLRHLAELDSVPMAELKTPAYRAAILRVRDEARTPRGTPLAPRTIIHVHRTFALMFRTAVAEGVVEVNPCVLLPGDLPAKRDKDPTWRKTARFYRPEIRALVSDERNPEDRRVFWGTLFLGATRFGEASALRWSDYDPTARPLGKLIIERSYSTKKQAEKETKTETPREMPVHPALAALLAAWKATGWRELMGRDPTPDDLIIPSREGRNRNVNHMLRRFKQDCERIGISPRRQHDTRRTFISLAREGGASDLLKWCTHGAPGEIIDQYTTPSWEKLCAEVLCFRLEDEDEIDGPEDDLPAQNDEEAEGVTPSTSGQVVQDSVHLDAKYSKLQRGGRDSNPRPPA